MRVKCLAQEHNTMTRPGLEPGPFDQEFGALTIRPSRVPQAFLARFIISVGFRFRSTLGLYRDPLDASVSSQPEVFRGAREQSLDEGSIAETLEFICKFTEFNLQFSLT